jgi:hypothetical protein
VLDPQYRLFLALGIQPRGTDLFFLTVAGKAGRLMRVPEESGLPVIAAALPGVGLDRSFVVDDSGAYVLRPGKVMHLSR